MTTRRILAVDDDPAMLRLLASTLGLIGDVEVEGYGSALAALARLEAAIPDLIIADVMMPGLDGFGFCERVRATEALAEVPFMFVTIRGAQADKYLGFSRGADDYLVKPVDPVELQLRVKALLRRRAGAPASEAGRAEPGRLAVGKLALDPTRSTARFEDVAVRLTATEFAVLAFLAGQPDQLVRVAEVLAGVLGSPEGAGNPAVVHTHVRNIRRKFREAGREASFLTSSRQGYRLVTL